MKLSKLRASTSTRHLAGATIPRQNTTSFGMRHALKKGGTRYAGESGEVEGNAARPRLDRPGRKAGGRVCKEEGGRISEDSKREAARLHKEADEKGTGASAEVMKGFPGVLAGAALQGLSKGRLGKTAGTLLGGASALSGIGAGAQSKYDGIRARREARRIEKGLVKEGEEDRKSGGRVGRANGGPAWQGEGDSAEPKPRGMSRMAYKYGFGRKFGGKAKPSERVSEGRRKSDRDGDED